ncbi:MAG TPA: hypothetical protein VK200_01065, partial [Candidatus Limnocylindrales bacterium]|nr:hypothetical protein [Candidatus Limnocylindrales bacterium]
MTTRRLEFSATVQTSQAGPRDGAERPSALRATQELLKKWLESPKPAAREAKFIDNVKKIAAQTREAQRFEKRCAKQIALNHINGCLKDIADGLEAAIEKEAKENGTGILIYEILHPETNSAKSGDFPQLPNDARAVIFEDDIRKTPAFAYLTGKCTRLGVKLDLVEQWSNIAW